MIKIVVCLVFSIQLASAKDVQRSMGGYDLLEQEISTHKFPEGFMFGVATSAYQIEGARNEDGKVDGMWDYICHKTDLIRDKSNGDVACDSYHKYKEDVQLIKNLGVKYYRFSISWPRMFTDIHTTINPKGIEYYNNLIDELIANGITPMVTMYHWDLPLDLHEKDQGLLNPHFIEYYMNYADLLFKTYGDRVKWWFTFNEPNNCCDQIRDAVKGDTEYRCSKNLLLAHARTWRLYDQKYRETQKGKITMVIDAIWYEPGSSAQIDVDAAERYHQFMTGIWVDPIFRSGDYPVIVKDYVRKQSEAQGLAQSRLPLLSIEEQLEIVGTHDFFAINHYTTKLVQYQLGLPPAPNQPMSRENDAQVYVWQPHDWPGADDENNNGITPWFKVVPKGFRKILAYIKSNYANPDILITENGFSDSGQKEDTSRIAYYEGYLSAVLDAIHIDGVKVRGYMAWSLMDNFEWVEGYWSKFGLHHVDFNSPELTRTPKASAKWYTNVIKANKINAAAIPLSRVPIIPLIALAASVVLMFV